MEYPICECNICQDRLRNEYGKRKFLRKSGNKILITPKDFIIIEEIKSIIFANQDKRYFKKTELINEILGGILKSKLSFSEKERKHFRIGRRKIENCLFYLTVVGYLKTKNYCKYIFYAPTKKFREEINVNEDNSIENDNV